MIKVTVWNEYFHEKTEESVASIYPNGIHTAIADFLRSDDIQVRTATLEDEECGLTEEVLKDTDVLIWWGHVAHEQVPDELVEKIHDRILRGMGLIVLHSGHYSKIFRKTLGTTCSLKWREGDRERVWNIAPNHPITQGIGEYFYLENEEMYGERFDVPNPDELVLIGWFGGGEVFRSGCVWNRGLGKVFYFQPGHESNPTFKHPAVQKIITNAVRYVAPLNIQKEPIDAPCAAPAEDDLKKD